MKYRFLAPAKQELIEAVAYFDSERNGLGDDLLDEIDVSIRRILEFPEAHSLVTQNIRRGRIKRFPYGLLYQVYQNEVIFIALMHERREPGYWKNRLGK